MTSGPSVAEPPSQYAQAHSVPFMVFIAILVAAMLSVAAVSFAIVLGERGLPEWVLGEYIDALNDGDAEAAADQTIAALMDEESLSEEAEDIEEQLRTLGDYRYWVTNVSEYPGDGTGVPKFTIRLAGDAMYLLETEYGVEFDHEYDEFCYISADFHIESSELGETYWHGWVILLKPGAQWYLFM